MPAAMGDKRKLTPQIHRHYLQPFPSAAERTAPWVLARELIGSSDWYDSLWNVRERIRDKPALLLWGMKDPAFRPSALLRWRDLFTHPELVPFPQAGHLVQEEERERLVPIIRRFLEHHAAARYDE